MEKSYVRFYALREMRARPKTFLPLFAIFFGVMLLMGNLLIYFQCQLTSNVAYYKVETQLILPDITAEEVPFLRQIEYVNKVEPVEDEDNTYTCYVELTEDKNTKVRAIGDCLLDIIDRLKLEERSDPYIHYVFWYHDSQVGPSEAISRSNLFNGMYIDALQDGMFQPQTIMLACIAALMLFAVVVLVYRMKIAQASKEYACLVGMGMSLGQLGKIQYLQGFLLLTAAFIPSQLLAIATMKLVSVLSYWIYPEFDGNQALMFDIPWSTLGILFLLYLIAMMAGVFLCLHPYRTRSVSAILSGAADRIPFVARSSEKFLHTGSFDGYGKVWKKRNLRNVLPVMVLFCALILFPAFLFGAFLGGVEDMADALNNTGSRSVVRMHSYTSGGGAIPYDVVKDLSEIPEVDGVRFGWNYQIPGLASLEDGMGGYMPIDASGSTVECAYYMITAFAEERPAEGEIWVCPDFPAEVGDTVTLRLNGKRIEAVVGRKHPDMASRIPAYDKTKIIYDVAFDETMYPALYGDKPIAFAGYITIMSSVPDDQIAGLLEKIAILTGDTKVYLNDHDRRIHGVNERSYVLENNYYQNRINTIKSAFLSIFFLFQTLYLMLCAASVIGSTLDFQLSRRRGEFAVLRALGLEDEAIHALADSYTGLIFRWVIPLLYPVMVLILYFSDPEAGLRTDDFGEKYIGALRTLYYGLGAYAVTCGILYLLYGGTARFASRKSTDHMLTEPLAEAVKERE
ncbi:MAG: hypothetical protein IJ480_03300 [Clostridia bacterium]|nr:hypothetical protein [Clostridia bacterium]